MEKNSMAAWLVLTKMKAPMNNHNLHNGRSASEWSSGFRWTTPNTNNVSFPLVICNFALEVATKILVTLYRCVRIMLLLLDDFSDGFFGLIALVCLSSSVISWKLQHEEHSIWCSSLFVLADILRKSHMFLKKIMHGCCSNFSEKSR